MDIIVYMLLSTKFHTHYTPINVGHIITLVTACLLTVRVNGTC